MPVFSFYAFVLVAGVVVWALGIVSRRLKAFVGPPLLIPPIGIAFGAVVSHPDKTVLLEHLEVLSWFAAGFGVGAVALRFRGQDIARLWRPGTVVTVTAMAGMWAVSTLIIWLLLDVSFKLALLIGAVVTPTDPVIASSIVSGPFAEQHIPGRVRRMLAFESGTNDGLAFPFLFLPLLLIEQGNSGWTDWALETVAWQVFGAAAVGALVGYASGRVCKLAIERGVLPSKGVLLVSVAITVAVLGLMKVINVDSIWAFFIAAMVFTSLLPGDERRAANEFQEGGSYVAMVPTLMVFGMVIPWGAWGDLGFPAVVMVVAVLLVRRLPAVAALYVFLKRTGPGDPEGFKTNSPFQPQRDLWFYGWFGPIGISAIYYATIADRRLEDDRIWAAASLLIAASILVHGATAAAGTLLYARAGGNNRGQPEQEAS